MKDSFGRVHPVICLIYFICIIVVSMLYVNPIIGLGSVLGAFIYVAVVDKWNVIKSFLKLLPLGVAITLINPIFSTYGDTVMFNYFNNRPYTFESMVFGAYMALICVATLLWFSRFNDVMTTDKLTYIFSKIMPAISTVLVLGLRYVPLFRDKITKIYGNRKSIGKTNDSNYMESIKNGANILSIMTTWSLENSTVSADSMKSRGYGLKNRTTYSNYKLNYKDIMLVILMLVGVIGIIFGVKANMEIIFYPTIIWNKINVYTMVSIFGYILLFALPSCINIVEDIRWFSLKLKN